MKPKILVTYPIPQEAIEKLKNYADVQLKFSMSKDQLKEEVTDIEGVVLGLEEFNNEVMEQAPNLKIIARFGVGYDNIELKAATDRNIFVTYTPNVLSDAVADLTIAFILTLSRRITDADHFVKSKDWSVGNKFPLGFDLANKTLGIVGLGRIGMKVLERSIAFKMNVIYNSRTHKMEAEKKYGIKFVELDELFRISDYISLHAPATRNTQGLVGKKELELMKKTSFLINTSRGSLIHQKDLYEALRDKKIAGAALDVFEVEPISQDDPLLRLENVVLTPHIGSGTYETRLSMAMMAIDDVIRVFEGKEPKNLINTELANPSSNNR